jgi:methylenetetrahydrofolate dehydrogenase (NADP+) / methenyltetrahydrofolate cyclohydrolase
MFHKFIGPSTHLLRGTSNILDSTLLSNRILYNIQNTIEKNNYNIMLNSVIVGDNKDSQKYINIKKRVCERLNIRNEVLRFDKSITENELIDRITDINADDNVHGLLIQSPLPRHIDSYNIFSIINKKKDVDCFNPSNIGNLYYNRNSVSPCTPRGILTLLDYYNIEVRGKNIVIIGSSNIVGKPLSILLSNRDATPILCNIETNNITALTRKADIIISACGQKEIVDRTWIGKNKPVIIDVGCNIVNGKMYGDVNFKDVLYHVSGITPVPGGIGPMTISMLMLNILELYEKYHIEKNMASII